MTQWFDTPDTVNHDVNLTAVNILSFLLRACSFSIFLRACSCNRLCCSDFLLCLMAASACHDKSSRDSSPHAFSVSSQEPSSAPLMTKFCLSHEEIMLKCYCTHLSHFPFHYWEMWLQTSVWDYCRFFFSCTHLKYDNELNFLNFIFVLTGILNCSLWSVNNILKTFIYERLLFYRNWTFDFIKYLQKIALLPFSIW